MKLTGERLAYLHFGEYDPTMSQQPSIDRQISLLDMLGGANLAELVGSAKVIGLAIPDSYLNDLLIKDSAFEVLAIQRLLTLAQRCELIIVRWEAAVARRVLASPAVHPLAALTICLSNAEHELPTDILRDPSLTIERSRINLLKHRLSADMFSDSQMLVCADRRRFKLPSDLYDDAGRLRGEEEFESFVDDLLSKQSLGALDYAAMSRRRTPTAITIRELFQNTDDHAKTNEIGEPLRPNSLRGLVIKRVFQPRKIPEKNAKDSGPVPCLEISIFDSGIGYYDSYRRQLLRGQARGEPVAVGEKQADTLRRFSLGPDVPIDVEYAILLKCLERHSSAEIPDSRPGHRGMGLYEVLRALQHMGGLFEVRTGRLHGYRSFLQGDLKLQLEPSTSLTKPGRPKPSLLDVEQPMLRRPTSQEQLVGSVIRIVVPLQ